MWISGSDRKRGQKEAKIGTFFVIFYPSSTAVIIDNAMDPYNALSIIIMNCINPSNFINSNGWAAATRYRSNQNDKSEFDSSGSASTSSNTKLFPPRGQYSSKSVKTTYQHTSTINTYNICG